MLAGALGKSKSDSLLNEYASLVGDAVLRERTRHAEHKARIEIELAKRVKSEFLANMSHELRTPLNTVIGFSKLLSDHGKQKLDDGQIVQYAELIRDAGDHLLSVINDILDITKMQSGAYALESNEVELVDVLHACVASQKSSAQDAGVILRENIAFNLPPVRGDDAKLAQAFKNLLSNAVKFTHHGGEVVLKAFRQGDGGVIISVRDDGIGMSDEEARSAVLPFGQADGARTRLREGMGLGLPIAKALIELHGGKLMITSVKGKGTEITVRLPPRDQVSVAEGRDAVYGRGVPAARDDV